MLVANQSSLEARKGEHMVVYFKGRLSCVRDLRWKPHSWSSARLSICITKVLVNASFHLKLLTQVFCIFLSGFLCKEESKWATISSPSATLLNYSPLLLWLCEYRLQKNPYSSIKFTFLQSAFFHGSLWTFESAKNIHDKILWESRA